MPSLHHIEDRRQINVPSRIPNWCFHTTTSTDAFSYNMKIDRFHWRPLKLFFYSFFLVESSSWDQLYIMGIDGRTRVRSEVGWLVGQCVSEVWIIKRVSLSLSGSIWIPTTLLRRDQLTFVTLERISQWPVDQISHPRCERSINSVTNLSTTGQIVVPRERDMGEIYRREE